MTANPLLILEPSFLFYPGVAASVWAHQRVAQCVCAQQRQHADSREPDRRRAHRNYVLRTRLPVYVYCGKYKPSLNNLGQGSGKGMSPNFVKYVEWHHVCIDMETMRWLYLPSLCPQHRVVTWFKKRPHELRVGSLHCLCVRVFLRNAHSTFSFCMFPYEPPMLKKRVGTDGLRVSLFEVQNLGWTIWRTLLLPNL